MVRLSAALIACAAATVFAASRRDDELFAPGLPTPASASVAASRQLMLAAASSSSLLAPANESSVVLWGPARFTFLTARTVRMQLSLPKGKPSGSSLFDDRPSFAVINRLLPAPPALKISAAGDTLTVETGSIVLTFTSPGGNSSSSFSSSSSSAAHAASPADSATLSSAAAAASASAASGPASNSSCAAPFGADVEDGSRTAAYPFGANVSALGGCCALCDADPDCTLFIYATDGPQSPNCWLMEHVTATYPSGSRMVGGWVESASNVTVRFTLPNGTAVTWSPGGSASSDDSGNNRGTSLWLDCYDSPGSCVADGESDLDASRGFTSRDGWAVMDDTASARFVPPAAPLPPLPPQPPTPAWYANGSTDLIDLYGFFHGHDYAGALGDYVALGGPAPLPPYGASGVWWSKWSAFSEADVDGLILANYSSHNLPLNMLVMDVDWHTENAGVPSGSCYSYGGFTPNRELFPTWEAFIASLHDGSNPTGRPLQLLLNIHPQGGLDHCQANWPYFASLMGIDTSNVSYIQQCDFGNQTFASAMFAAFVDNTSAVAPGVSAVDHWWTDHNGCTGPDGTAGVNGNGGMGWANYLFYAHQQMQGGDGKRAMVLSRWGGIGNHRTPLQFSGDCFQDPAILQFQLKFTPTAANVLASWSHDIGAFHAVGIPGDGFPANVTGSEVYLRWIQAGVTFPVFRTHCTTWGDEFGRPCERRIWMFEAHYEWMADAMRLRSALQPYLYTEQRFAFDSGVVPVHPLYFHFPEEDGAYSDVAAGEYFFGRSVLSAPVSAVTDNSTGLAPKTVWLPPGQWLHWNGSSAGSWAGPMTLPQTQWGVWEVPLFVPANAVLPMKTMASVTDASPDPLVWVAWPSSASSSPPLSPLSSSAAAAVHGAGTSGGLPVLSGSYTVYEDDGASLGYQGASASGTAGRTAAQTATLTSSSSSSSSGAATYSVELSAWSGGGFAGFPSSRGYEVQMRGLGGAVASVQVNGQAVPASSTAAPGYFFVAASNGTLAAPQGALVVRTGSFGAAQPVVVEVALASAEEED